MPSPPDVTGQEPNTFPPEFPGEAAHALSIEQALQRFNSSQHGLSQSEALARLNHFGPNALPEFEQPGAIRIFISQFANPLIYILAAAAVLAILIDEWSDAGFIAAVLLINAIIGSIQEHSAQKAASALQQLVRTSCKVLREGDIYEIDSAQLVYGDILLLESGDKVAADIRLIQSHDLEVDESLLTGESQAILKQPEASADPEAVIGDRLNMAFAGTMTNRGRGRGVVVGTALDTEIGRIASDVLQRQPTKAPLLVRMEVFTRNIAMLVGMAVLLMAVTAVLEGTSITEIFMLAVALAVSAIPEGLPVALTVALAIGMQRMARRNVIVRKLVAVEALGSCTFIATDKTGTLTINQMTARRIAFPGMEPWEVTGEGMQPEGAFLAADGTPAPEREPQLERVCLAVTLSNDAFLGRRDDAWVHHGDAVDVALLVMAHKAGINKAEASNAFPELASIPFESERKFSASLNASERGSGKGAEKEKRVFVKGAFEKLLPMCNRMEVPGQPEQSIDIAMLEAQMHELASEGYRILAVAHGSIELDNPELFSEEHLTGLSLLGFVAMIDPLRTEAKAAIGNCRDAGIEVAMITGDHPATAFAIARELELVDDTAQVVTGPQLKEAMEAGRLDDLTRTARVFARVEPHQKLDIVQSLQRGGHFVAVSGDGANDAPALRAAHVGVAMGKNGTDVARETAELIITDDNFSSIVAGIEEGRIAYANVRKVIFLLISTGASELVLFALALLTALPLPLHAVQLLWLNLVTNGIQDVALAFEPGEGHELRRPPREPKEPIFNRLMIERVVISALVIGVAAFLLFYSLLSTGMEVEEARNATLLLMVLFENIHVFNSRSETRYALAHNPLRNPLLLFGTAIAQLVHIGAMYVPWLSEVLHISPVPFALWLELLGIALIVLAAMELHKMIRRRFFPQHV